MVSANKLHFFWRFKTYLLFLMTKGNNHHLITLDCLQKYLCLILLWWEGKEANKYHWRLQPKWNRIFYCSLSWVWRAVGGGRSSCVSLHSDSIFLLQDALFIWLRENNEEETENRERSQAVGPCDAPLTLLPKFLSDSGFRNCPGFATETAPYAN